MAKIYSEEQKFCPLTQIYGPSPCKMTVIKQNGCGW